MMHGLADPTSKIDRYHPQTLNCTDFFHFDVFWLQAGARVVP